MFHSKSLQQQLIFFWFNTTFFWLKESLHKIAQDNVRCIANTLLGNKWIYLTQLDKLFKKVIQINLLNLEVVTFSMEGMLLLRVIHYLFILCCFHLSVHSLRLQSFTSNLIPASLDTSDQPHSVPLDVNFLRNLDISNSTFRKNLHLYLCAS